MQTIDFSVSIVSISKTVLYQTIQFSISTQFKYQNSSISSTLSTQISFIQPIDRALSEDNFPSQSEPGSDSNEGVLHIPQSSSITGSSLSVCLVSYTGHLLFFFTPLQRCSRCILQAQPTGQFWMKNNLFVHNIAIV